METKSASVHRVDQRTVLESDQELVIQGTYALVATWRGSFQMLRRLSNGKPLLGWSPRCTKPDLEEQMRKLMVLATAATIASVGIAGRAGGQVYYPNTPNTPSRVQGRYGYPSSYPGYPQQQYPQYPTTSQRHHVKKHHAKMDRDGDDDDNGRRGDDRTQHDNGRHNGFDHSRHYGYGTSGNGQRSRMNEHDSGARTRGRYGQGREDRSNREGRDRW